MMRFLLIIGLCLIAAFTGIGSILSREWGWDENASPDLFLIYSLLTPQQPYPFVILNTDGSDQQSELIWNQGALTALACSPDGLTLAFLTDTAHLYIINQSGILYDRPLGQGYDAIDVANNGTVAVGKTTVGIDVIFDPKGHYSPVRPDHIAYDPIKIASSGASLWSHTGQGGITMLSPSGEPILELPQAQGSKLPEWLASEQMFSFSYWDGTFYSGGIADASSRNVVRLHNGITSFGVFSPDATWQALAGYDAANKPQLFLVDALSGEQRRQLTHDTGIYQTPVCFLTFQPHMLIAAS